MPITSLPAAVSAAHNLSRQGQEKLRAAIAEKFGPQEPIKKEPSQAEIEAAEKAKVAAEQAKIAEEARAKREETEVAEIIAALTANADGTVPDDVRAGALRAINEVIGVTEVKAAPTPRGKLPDDFPGAAALAEVGITTYAQLRKAGDVTEIKDIGPATAAKIKEALAATPEGGE
jgi:cell wall-associated NlpC family hydrolase